MITKQERTVYNGMPGTVITTVKLISRDEFRQTRTGAAHTGQVLSVGELFAAGVAEIPFLDPYTGKQETFSREVVQQAFADGDLNNAIVDISAKFVPDPEFRHLGAPSRMADELRRRGWPEETVQQLLAWERDSEKPD